MHIALHVANHEVETACSSCASAKPDPTNDPVWRLALWIALGVNATMFIAEMAAGVAGGSKALQADALDFLGDSANYAISLGVAGMALAWRARAALLKGATLAALGVYVLAITVWAIWNGRMPEAEVMNIVGGRGSCRQCRGRDHALPFPQRRREYALGLDLLAQ